MGECKEKKCKATRKSISLEIKMQVLRRLDAGERQSVIGTALNLSTSTIRTILKNKEKILSSATATTRTSATKITRSRSNVIEEMEKRLAIWIEGNVPLSQAVIMKEARTIFNNIQNEKGDTSENFVASRGWFYRFKNRSNLHDIQISGEAASGDPKAAAAFSATINERAKNIWSQLSKNADTRESIVPLAKEPGLVNIINQDIKESLQVTDENLKKLGEQVQEDEQKALSTEFLEKSIANITEIMDQFVQNDLNFDRSSKARQSVIDAMSCYRQLLAERQGNDDPP